MERSALYRGLFIGLADADAEDIGDRIEVLATITAPQVGGTTASAWGELASGALGARTLSAPQTVQRTVSMTSDAKEGEARLKGTRLYRFRNGRIVYY